MAFEEGQEVTDEDLAERGINSALVRRLQKSASIVAKRQPDVKNKSNPVTPVTPTPVASATPEKGTV